VVIVLLRVDLPDPTILTGADLGGAAPNETKT
jgi:hypothetical protein